MKGGIAPSSLLFQELMQCSSAGKHLPLETLQVSIEQAHLLEGMMNLQSMPVN